VISADRGLVFKHQFKRKHVAALVVVVVNVVVELFNLKVKIKS